MVAVAGLVCGTQVIDCGDGTMDAHFGNGGVDGDWGDGAGGAGAICGGVRAGRGGDLAIRRGGGGVDSFTF